MNMQTRETCWFCEAKKADPSASVVLKLCRGKKGNREIKEVSIPRCSNCQMVHSKIDSMEFASLEPETKEGKQILLMKGVYVPLSSILIGFSVLALFLLIGYLAKGDGRWMCGGTVVTTIAVVLLWAIVGGIKKGIKLEKARNQYRNEMGIKAAEKVVNHPDIGNLFEAGWKIDELPLSKKPPAIEHLPAKPVATSTPPGRPSKYSGDGYLLPEYWRCIVCKASKEDKQANSAFRVGLFAMAIEDDSCFQELGQIERKEAHIYIQYISDPLGGVKARPPGTERFEDTGGLARDRNGLGFDAVFLCDTHAGEMKKRARSENMFSKKDYEEMVQTLRNGEGVEISGFKAAVELIFDHALDSLPVLSESKYKVAYERDFWGQTWMASPYEGSLKEVQAFLIKNANPSLEREKFSIQFVLSEPNWVLKERGIKYEDAIEHILFLLIIPNGLDTIARIYKTELGVRAVPNKARIQSH